jgi:hypothetical protein
MADLWHTVLNPDGTQNNEGVARLTAAAAWPGAPIEDLETLEDLLDTAREQVIAYAPTRGVTADGQPAPLPRRYYLAQVRQAQNLWNAGQVSSSGEVGEGQFVFTPRPMDKTIKSMIRPADGKPHVL